MKTVRTLIVCLSLIVAGVLFNTGSAYAAGPGSRGGDNSCTTQQSPFGNPIIRCAVQSSDKTENGAPKHEWHRHHHFFHHHFRFSRRHRYSHHHHH